MDRNAEELFYQSARMFARHQARSWGLSGDLAEELEQSFVVAWLLKPTQPPIWTWPAARRDSYLRRAAKNHAVNFMNRLRAEKASLDAYSATLPEADPRLEDLTVAPLLRKLFWQQIRSGLHRLRPGTGDMFVSYYVESATIDELESASGRTNQAVRQNLAHTRRRLRSILAADGNTEAELRSYVDRPGH